MKIISTKPLNNSVFSELAVINDSDRQAANASIDFHKVAMVE